MTKCISAISSEAQLTCVVAAAPLMHRGEPAESTCWRAYTANEHRKDNIYDATLTFRYVVPCSSALALSRTETFPIRLQFLFLPCLVACCST